MPSYTYPGVYIQELPSAVHTITGVATSIAAFIGWADKGPTNEAVLVQSFPDFERQFGGLDARSLLGYSVNQFFGNGGQQAYIVRLAWDPSFPAAPGASLNPAVTAGATGIGNATSTITAAFGGVSGQTLLAVSAPTLTSITVTPASPTIPAGATQQFTATGTYSDGSTLDLTSAVTWNSATIATATISTTGGNIGLATAVAAGTSVITAAKGGVTSPSVTLTVSTATLKSIAVTPASPTIPAGATQQFTATGIYSDGSTLDLTSTATWNSATAATATISTTGSNIGLATAVAAGTSAITAAKSGVTSPSVTLTVSTATLKSIAVTPANPTIPVGTSQQFTATGTYSDGSTQDLTSTATWNSATAATATINTTGSNIGLATAVAAGTSAITAASGGVTSPSVTLTVSTAVPISIVVTPANPTVQVGLTQQLTATGRYSDGSTYDLTKIVLWTSAPPTVASVSGGGLATGLAANSGALTLYASSPGQWGNSLSVRVNVGSTGRFGLTVQDTNGNTLESFVNLSANSPDPLGRYAVTVIDNDSQYVTFVNPSTGGTPSPLSGTPATTAAPVALFGGADGSVLNPATDGNFETALGITPLPNKFYGIHLLDNVPIFNLLCVPGETDASTIQALQQYCSVYRAFYIVDSPQIATTSFLSSNGPVGTTSGSPDPSSNLSGQYSINSAYYFPWVLAPDPLAGNRPALFPPCGFVAGIYAATDASRGVWKAPAGIDAGLSRVNGLQYTLTDLQNGTLNTQAVNCLRTFRVYGTVVWGARTLDGSDADGSQWQYVPIRRFALFLESSLYQGTQWAVFEPNDQTLWGQLRLNIGAFMQGLFQQGAFAGATPQLAYFVKCDSENNPQASIDQGIVTVLVGFAPLYPAEFVVIQIQQIAGQLSP
jgi:phage tail sheath protein FI